MGSKVINFFHDRCPLGSGRHNVKKFACPVTFLVQMIGFQTANEVAVILTPCCRQERESEREQK